MAKRACVIPDTHTGERLAIETSDGIGKEIVTTFICLEAQQLFNPSRYINDTASTYIYSFLYLYFTEFVENKPPTSRISRQLG